jgi:hypothetical protein
MYINLFIRLERPPALELHLPVNIDLLFLVLVLETCEDLRNLGPAVLDLDGSYQPLDLSVVAVDVDFQALHFRFRCSQMNER